MTDDTDRLASRRRVLMVVEAYDRDSFKRAMRAAVGLVNDGESRVELQIGRQRVAKWSITMAVVEYEW